MDTDAMYPDPTITINSLETMWKSVTHNYTNYTVTLREIKSDMVLEYRQAEVHPAIHFAHHIQGCESGAYFRSSRYEAGNNTRWSASPSQIHSHKHKKNRSIRKK